MKAAVKALMKHLPFALSQNQRYDQQTRSIIRQRLSASSNCIDVGCHKGEILDEILAVAPEGRHYAFEPIPVLAEALENKYARQAAVGIYRHALSDEAGEASFNYVTSNPSYSGLLRRTYDRAGESDEMIIVRTARLDDLIAAGTRIDLIKIDVEGGELGVLRGARRLLAEQRPLVIFEFGIGAADHYGATPEKLYEVLAKAGLSINTLSGYLKQEAALLLPDFANIYAAQSEYYFVATP